MADTAAGSFALVPPWQQEGPNGSSTLGVFTPAGDANYAALPAVARSLQLVRVTFALNYSTFSFL